MLSHLGLLNSEHLLLGCSCCINQPVTEEGGATAVSVAALPFVTGIKWFPIGWTIQVLRSTLHGSLDRSRTPIGVHLFHQGCHAGGMWR